MIEVEKKFQLSAEKLTRLLEGATKLSEKQFTDVYYDSPDWQLTTRDTWLRAREGVFELKVPLTTLGEDRKADQYHEITDEQQIKKALHLSDHGSLKQALVTANLTPFATITTNRKKYRHGKFTIDVDQADFGYSVTEIELEAPSEADIERVTEEILAFAKSKGLEPKKLNGKVCEYIERKNPAHYQALVTAGVFGNYVWRPKNKSA